MKTAIEWLAEELQKNHNVSIDIKNTVIYQQAMEREKVQINKAYYDGYYEEFLYDARRYYVDTYGEHTNANSVSNT